MKYSIDGFFMTQRSTGTQRYSTEILCELDRLITSKNIDIEIVVPKWFEGCFDYDNIKIVKYGTLKGISWEQIDFAIYVYNNQREGIYLNNVFSLFVPKGIIVIHDVCYKVHPEFYKSLRDKLSMIWHRANYFLALHSNMKIVTVSNFSRSEMIRVYGVREKKISVINSAWQHINRMVESPNIFLKYPILKRKEGFYLSVSTLGANKNYKWILCAAYNNPDELFVIVGGGKLKGADDVLSFRDLSNVLILGYVDDSEMKSLMAGCKGFLFPTLYEGFGLTPLEAIACGARRVFVSDIPCMREIYGDGVFYIDPNDFNYRFSDIDKEVPEMKEMLGKYSWEKSAKEFLNILMVQSEKSEYE